jgi:hypothetical protein
MGTLAVSGLWGRVLLAAAAVALAASAAAGIAASHASTPTGHVVAANGVIEAD